MALWNFLNSLGSNFSKYWYSWFWKFLSIASRGCEFSFFRRIHGGIDIRINLSNSIRPMNTERGKQVHLEELNQVSVIKHMVVTSAHQGLMNFKRCLKLLSGRVIITKYAQNCCKDTPIKSRPTSTGKLEAFLPIKSHNSVITWSCNITWQTKILHFYFQSG